MVEYMVGDFLVQSGKLGPGQLSAILDKMDSVRVKLGLIAVEEGFMTFKQAEEVNSLQASMNKRFGDIAIEKGYLTDAQVGKLLKSQGSTYFTLAQTLVNEGVITMDELDSIMEDFRQKNGFTNSELEIIKSDDVDGIVPILLPEELSGMENLVSIALKTVIRLVDRHASMGKVIVSDDEKFPLAAKQTLEGKDDNITTFFMESTGGLLVAASFFGQMDFEEIDEDALDAAAELVNCINGLYSTEKSGEGSFYELLPPQYDIEGLSVEGTKKYLVPFTVDGEEMYFGITKTV